MTAVASLTHIRVVVDHKLPMHTAAKITKVTKVKDVTLIC